ncbi:hypothetical protein GCM10010232_26690 [Streptomyces amakusaensis]|uniref:Uncharacterized protein n=1 Tax=Streptomyces amakusaensis TaxID=67271 RepID=A0ABW0ADR4_9ACTN
MQPADDTTKAALAAGERTATHTTRLGGRDVSAQVQSWQVERSYATDLPEAMRAFAGSSAAQFQLQLSGTGGKSSPELYSPWAQRASGDAARPGQSVVHEAGVGGGGALPAFRGTLRNRSAASGSDTVELSALDGAERLRGPAQLPRPYTGLWWRRPVATATWCVDELLRQAGIHSSPPPRAPEFQPDQPLSLVHATLHGGFATPYGMPEDLPDPRHYTWTRAGAPHEMALVPRGTPPGGKGVMMSWFPRSRVTCPGSKLFAEVWVNTALGTGDTARIELELNRSGTATGTLFVEVDFVAGTVTVGSESSATQGGTWVWSQWGAAMKAQRGVWHFGAFFDLTASGSTVQPVVHPRLTAPDGTHFAGTATPMTPGFGQQVSSELRKVRLVTSMAAEGLQVTAGLPGIPTAEEFAHTGTWTKTATLDEPILPLMVIPKVSGSQWEAITQIAKASLSTAEIDERGMFRWRNFTRFATVPTSPDLTLTTVRDIASLTLTEEIDACRNYCVQPVKDWSAVGIVEGAVVNDTEIREIPPYGSLTVSYTFAEEELDIGPPDTDDDSVHTYGSSFRVAPYFAGGAFAIKGAVDALIRREEGYVVLRLTNRTPLRLYTITKDGKPSVRIVSLKPSREPVERQSVSYRPGSASERFYGRQEFYAEADEWIQDSRAAQQLANAMRAAGEYPVPVMGDVQVLYDPRVQLGDVVRIQDPGGAVLDTLAWVVGISTTAGGDGGVQQTLSLRGTRSNGVPTDTGLTPDGPVAPPPPDLFATYASVKTAYPTLAALLAARGTWREVKENTGV